MGEGYSVSCSSCGFAQHFTVGVGMMYSSLDQVINLLHYTRRKKVLGILNDHEVHETDYEHRIFECPKCENLRGAFWAKIFYDNDQTYETEFICRECNKRMEPVLEPKQLRGNRCPNCGERRLNITEDILWD
jgi:DNA-directed RNA polymerase subunit RPC12/RpoP